MIYKLVAAAALLLVALALPTLPADAEPPMTEEEVVRRYVAGESVEALVREVERRDPQFDLSSEMLEELRHAGLPDALIVAMQERQSAREREVAEPAEAPPAPAAPKLVIGIVRQGSAGSSISIRRHVDPQLAAEWELGNAPEDRVFADLALYLACRTPDHVPDQWRTKSPLGRDFRSMPRHRMLAFVAGSAHAGEADQGTRIRLDLPPAIEVELETGVPHDLSLGLSVQVGGRYHSLTADSWDNLVVDEAGLALEAKVKGLGLKRLEVEFRGDEDDETDETDETDE